LTETSVPISLTAVFVPSMNVQPVIAALQKLGEGIADMATGPMFQANMDMAGMWDEFLQDRYDVFSRGGGDWAPLKESTIKRKSGRATMGGGRVGAILILIDRGDMRASMNRGEPNHFIQVLPDGITEGSLDPKIRFHQDGTYKMPAREVFVLPSSDVLAQMTTRGASGVLACAQSAGFWAV
jgi:hypothetical protein